MPATRKQMRTAGRERQLRREGKVRQARKGVKSKRPMGGMSDKNLRAFASWPDPKEQQRLAKAELMRRESGGRLRRSEHERFRNAPKETVVFYATATLDEIRQRNGERPR